jgi:hypothetical protein
MFNQLTRFSFFGLCPSSKMLKKNTTFRKPGLLPPSGNEAPKLVDPLNRAIFNLNRLSKCQGLKRWILDDGESPKKEDCVSESHTIAKALKCWITFNVPKFIFQPSETVSVFLLFLITTSDYFPTHHYLIDFYSCDYVYRTVRTSVFKYNSSYFSTLQYQF